jgi:6-phosphogluconolactonase
MWHACAPAALAPQAPADMHKECVRMKFASLRFAALSLLATLLLSGTSNIAMAKSTLLYIATQNPDGMGITVAEFNSDTGALTAPKMAIETRDPAHFTLSNDGKHLYMCNTGTPGGVSAFAVEKGGALRLLNYKESKGRGPSYVSVDGSGKYVLDANYGGGFVEVYSLAKDGSLDQQTAFVQHIGSSVNPQRQSKPYAHWFRTDPSNHFGLVADLGMDQVVIYKFDAKTGKLTPNDPAFTKVDGGMGPRHLAFHPNGKWVYGIAEIANEVMAFNWDGSKGTLTQFQSVKTLADGFKDPSTAAEIAVRADGKFLYASNRGEDTIVVYAIDAKSGELTLKQRTPSLGKVPRYFTFDPTNKWFIVSNQDGGNVAVFSVDAKTGALAPKGEPVPLVKPMAVVFLK